MTICESAKRQVVMKTVRKGVRVLPDHVNDSDMVLLARDISKQIEAELEYPGQIKVSVIRESRVVDYAK